VRGIPWLWLLLFTCSVQAAESYRLDAAQTQVSIEVRRLGIALLTAHFHQFAGALTVDRNGSDNRIDLTVLTNSIEGPDPQWNARLRSPEWLDAQRYPEMSYHSVEVRLGNQTDALAIGKLTLHGVTRPATVRVSRLDCSAEPPGSKRPCTFDAQAQIKRSDFGLPHGFWVGGDEVEILIRGVGIPSDR